MIGSSIYTALLKDRVDADIVGSHVEFLRNARHTRIDIIKIRGLLFQLRRRSTHKLMTKALIAI